MFGVTRSLDKMHNIKIYHPVFSVLGTLIPNIYSVVSYVMCWQQQESVDWIELKYFIIAPLSLLHFPFLSRPLRFFLCHLRVLSFDQLLSAARLLFLLVNGQNGLCYIV